uniref:Uncharacterized protein n=1 Tax=Anopheles quadriannulatus TaxID=34691 RepID=A0A182WWA8_ANOQN
MIKIALILALAVAVFGYGHEHHDYHSHPSYKFEYGVKDPHTGDHKSQWEHRDGDVVKGAYTLDEADGTKRVVEYSSDKHNGFQAHVKRITIAALALLAVAVAAYEHEDYHSHPSYKFEYGVKDPHTGDHKSQWEHRDGDVVKGAYTLDEADGTKRVVEYSSDKHNGFQAHVKRVGHAHHPEVYGHHEAGHSYSHGHAVAAYEHEDYHSHPSYKFEYGVKDPHTGDHKSQWEHRDGDIVKGAYTLDEADGTKRVVEYSSDKHNGFQAHVKRIIALTVACLAVAASAQYWGGAGYGYGAEHHGHHDYYSHPSYKFEYGVKDPHTGDHKSQWEHRDGDVVKGAYTLHEADGTERVVEYSSDKHNGFQAHVHRVQDAAVIEELALLIALAIPIPMMFRLLVVLMVRMLVLHMLILLLMMMMVMFLLRLL